MNFMISFALLCSLIHAGILCFRVIPSIGFSIVFYVTLYCRDLANVSVLNPHAIVGMR